MHFGIKGIISEQIKMATCKVDFENNPSKYCSAGTIIRAQITINSPKERRIRGIFVIVKGDARTSLCRGRTIKSAREIILNEKSYLFGGPKEDLDLPLGEHQYTFLTYLHHRLPSSMNGASGSIQYSIEVVMHYPGWAWNKTFVFPFEVVKYINLNDNPEWLVRVFRWRQI